MRKSHRRTPKNSRFRFRFRGLGTATLILVGILIWLAINMNAIVDCMKAYRLRNIAQDNLNKVTKEVRTLEGQKLSLKLGTFQNEKAARETYKLVKPGENLILLNPAESDERNSRAESEQENP